MKKLLYIIIFLSSITYGDSIEKNFTNKNFHFVHFYDNNKTSFFNWGKNFYFGSFIKNINIKQNENFVQKPGFENDVFIKEIRTIIFQHLLQININNEMTIKELVELSEKFQNLLRDRIYNPKNLFITTYSKKNITIKTWFTFLGKGNFLDLMIQCGYFIDRIKLNPIISKYHPQAFDKLVIELRHLKITPCLFPQIYSYDENGKLILIYSMAHCNLEKIIDNGYIRYYTNTKTLKINNTKTYYCSALKLYGTKKTDVIINREDYIKFFGSGVSLKNLAEGNLFFIIRQEKSSEE